MAVLAERFSSLNPSSGVASSRVWVQYPVMTLKPYSKALNHNGLITSWEGREFCSSDQRGS